MLGLILAEKAPEPEPAVEKSVKAVFLVSGAGVGLVSVVILHWSSMIVLLRSMGSTQKKTTKRMACHATRTTISPYRERT